jgi:hypothetical protein
VQEHPARAGQPRGKGGDLVDAVGGDLRLLDEAAPEGGPRVVHVHRDLGRQRDTHLAHDADDLVHRVAMGSGSQHRSGLGAPRRGEEQDESDEGEHLADHRDERRATRSPRPGAPQPRDARDVVGP